MTYVPLLNKLCDTRAEVSRPLTWSHLWCYRHLSLSPQNEYLFGNSLLILLHVPFRSKRASALHINAKSTSKLLGHDYHANHEDSNDPKGNCCMFLEVPCHALKCYWLSFSFLSSNIGSVSCICFTDVDLKIGRNKLAGKKPERFLRIGCH